MLFIAVMAPRQTTLVSAKLPRDFMALEEVATMPKIIMDRIVIIPHCSQVRKTWATFNGKPGLTSSPYSSAVKVRAAGSLLGTEIPGMK